MPRIRSLRARFALAISALVAFVLVANGLVLALANRRHLRDDLERRGDAYARLAVGPVCAAYETYYASGYSKFRELLLETMRLNPDLSRLAIYDTGGRLLFDSSELRGERLAPAPRAAPPRADAALGQAIRGLAATSWTVAERPGGSAPARIVVMPFVEEWGRHRYSVVFEIGYDSLRAAALEAGRRITWLSLGSLGLGVLIAMLLARQSVVPLVALTRGAQDIADGRLERRIELPRRDEFGVLAATFNQMAEKLAQTIRDLETSNRTLGRMNLDLQQLDRMKSDLLANVSHELRTPLTAISGYTEAIDDGLLGALSPPQHDALQVVRRNTRRLMAVIEQLLGFSRLEAGVARLDLSSFDLGEVAAHVVRTVRAGHGPELDLRLEVETGLPPVWGDAERLAQVIENLVTNAVKFTPPGGEIRVGLARRGGEVEVTVSDRGIGIPRPALGKIFERFYQVDASSTRRYGGMGLGLAIVRETLAAHGCEVAVESEEGMGTTFRFALPLALREQVEALA
jgi:signal transduction histidine kinase